jgi:enterochelin esterase family protein
MRKHVATAPAGVYAVPITQNFYASHQWLRELKRRNQGPIAGIYFRVPDAQPVWLGHYGNVHRLVTAAEAIAEFTSADDPLGWQVLIPRRIEAQEIHKVRRLSQVIGWRFSPKAKRKPPFCTCKFCTRYHKLAPFIRLFEVDERYVDFTTVTAVEFALMKPVARLVAFFAVAWGLTLAAGAGDLSLAPQLIAQSRPTLVSPEVLPDRSVIFRFWAPQTSEIKLSGNWMGSQPSLALTKGDDGVWTVKVPPLEPNIYSYSFIVDGVRTTDPACRCSFTSASRFSDSSFTVPGNPPRVWEPQNRPPGTLHYERFFSARQQRMRRFVVYTPPGYEASRSRKYPLLVLLPGTPGDENDWTSGGGFSEAMFDNLIATRQMLPMVVFMHASDVLDGSAARRSDENLHEFEAILTKELLPLAVKRYRLSTDPRSWAIAGLSLGGEFGMHVGLNHPELFRTVASLSGSLVPTDVGEVGRSSFEARFGPALAATHVRGYRLIWLGCGSEDIFFAGAQAFAERLKSAKIPHIFRQFSGPHSIPVARQELAELLPLLFRP